MSTYLRGDAVHVVGQYHARLLHCEPCRHFEAAVEVAVRAFEDGVRNRRVKRNSRLFAWRLLGQEMRRDVVDGTKDSGRVGHGGVEGEAHGGVAIRGIGREQLKSVLLPAWTYETNMKG